MHGNDRDDWFLAQSQLLTPVKFHIVERDDHLIAHAEVPGFSAHEIRVSVEPHHVRISGKAETPDEQGTGKEIMYSLGHSLMPAEQIFHVAELPTEVDPSKAKATFKDGQTRYRDAQSGSGPKRARPSERSLIRPCAVGLGQLHHGYGCHCRSVDNREASN